MTRLKGAAILGAMIIAGVTLLTSFPASSASFLNIRVSHIDRACKSVPETLHVCKFVARLVNRIGDLPAVTPSPADQAFVVRQFRAPVNKILNSKCCDGVCVGPSCPTPCNTPCADIADRCDKCVAVVSNIESYLATNGTSQLLADTMDNACDRFSDPADAQTCRDQIGGAMPYVIDWALANLPPLTTCQQLHPRACTP